MQFGPPHLTGGHPQEFNGRTTDMLLGQIVNELHHLRWDTHEIKGHLVEGHKRMDGHEDRIEALEKPSKDHKPSVMERLQAVVPVAQLIVGLVLIVLSGLGWFTPEQTKDYLQSLLGGGH